MIRYRLFSFIYILNLLLCSFVFSVSANDSSIIISQPKFYVNNNEVNNLIDGLITVRTDVTNSKNNTVTVQLILALFDNYGKLVNVAYKSLDILALNTLNVTTSINVDNSLDRKLKVFIWDNLIPLSEVFTLVPSTVTLYSTLPDAAESSTYSVSVNGQSVFVEKFKDISYARFSFSGTANINVSISDNITSSDISPHSFNIPKNITNNNMNFSVSQPRKLIITLNSNEKLFIFADSLETNIPDLQSENVKNIMNYSEIDITGETLNTAVIQKAIDDVAALPNGGILYFPDGKYKTATIKIRSNVTLYLSSGALIKGSNLASDYEYPLKLSDGSTINLSALVCFDQAENAKITGRGVIDGDGKILRLGRDVFLIETMQSKNITVEDVILRDPAAFNSHITYSDNVIYQRTKLINDITVPNTDGIDPDCSRNVLINDVFSYCSDDSISVKGGFYTSLIRDSYNIKVTNNVLWTKKSALKIGSETVMYNIYDILYENNDIVKADRALVCYVYDGATVSNVRWINNRAESIGGDSIQKLIDLLITTFAQSNNTIGKIDKVTIKDFYAEGFSPNSSTIKGFDVDHKITNVTIDNMVVDGVKRNNLSDARIILNEFTENITFGNAALSYPNPTYPVFVTGTFVENNGIVVIEAEHYSNKVDTLTHAWRVSTKEGFVGESAMEAYPDIGTAITKNIVTTSPRLDYKIYFNTPGTYYVWTRIYNPDTDSDTFHVGLNGEITIPTTLMCTYGLPKNWFWNNKNKGNTYSTITIPSTGLYTFNLWMGEDGMIVDKFVLMQATDGTILPKYVQTGRKGVGPFESGTTN